MDVLTLFEDMLFSGVAAVGFASINNSPRRALKYCALSAAIGHCLRTILMHYGIHIIFASLLAAFAIGVVAIPLARSVKSSPASVSFPSMLPMIPGMYAYRTVQGLIMCLASTTQDDYLHYLYVMCNNGFTCLLILAALVFGVILPTFIFQKLTFSATKVTAFEQI